MTKFCKSKLNFIVCLSVGLFLVFSIPALAQVKVSDPVILDASDYDMPGKWRDNGFGECFYLLPGGGDEEFVGPDFIKDNVDQYRIPYLDPNGELNICFGAAVDFLFPANIDGRIYRNGNEPGLAFSASPSPADDIQEMAKLNPGCFPGNDLTMGSRGTTWDDGDSTTGVGILPPMASELKINFEGSLSLAYYFVNGEAPVLGGIKFEECRTQDFILSVIPSVGGPVTKTGTVGEFSRGKYVVFELDGLEGETLLRFETVPSSQDLCSPVLGTKCTKQNFPNCNYVPGENDVLSGVFIDDCCPLEVTKVAEPDDIVCDSGTNGPEDPCLVPCEDTGTDGDFTDDLVCVAETVTYTITVTNTSSKGTLTDVTVVDVQLDIVEVFETLGPGESETITVEGVCLEEYTENTVEVSAKLSEDSETTCTAEATATVTTGFECNDTGTDGY